MNRDPQHADIVVVGGGPCGALTALLLAEAGRRVLLIEARGVDADIVDARALALSWASRARLERVGAWPVTLAVSHIDSVHISQQGCWGRTVIGGADVGLAHLGVVVDYPALTRAMDARLAAAGVEVMWGCRVTGIRQLARYAELRCQSEVGERRVTCRLAVMAEGGALIDQLPGITRQVFDYQQSALLAQVATEQAPRGVAYERFSQSGPLALLPHGDGYMLVWTRSHQDAQRLQQADGQTLAAELQQAFGERQGRVLSVSRPALFPLAMRRASSLYSERVVLIGNAAQTLHPVAAQGLNLGIRDACALAEALSGASDPGAASALAAYAAMRRLDRRAVIGFTHGLMRVFESHGMLANRVRGIGMNVLDSVPGLRRRFAGHLVFGVGVAS